MRRGEVEVAAQEPLPALRLEPCLLLLQLPLIVVVVVVVAVWRCGWQQGWQPV